MGRRERRICCHPGSAALVRLRALAGRREGVRGGRDAGLRAAGAEPGLTSTPLSAPGAQPWLCATLWPWASTRATR